LRRLHNWVLLILIILGRYRMELIIVWILIWSWGIFRRRMESLRHSLWVVLFWRVGIVRWWHVSDISVRIVVSLLILVPSICILLILLVLLPFSLDYDRCTIYYLSFLYMTLYSLCFLSLYSSFLLLTSSLCCLMAYTLALTWSLACFTLFYIFSNSLLFAADRCLE